MDIQRIIKFDWEEIKMHKKRILSLLIIAAFCLSLLPQFQIMAKAADPEPPTPIFEDPSYSFEERAADLVARMSVAQKGSQMISQGSSAITAAQLGGGALNVPATKGISSYTWWSEALHGYSNGTGANNSTSYPQSLTAGSSWNRELYYREAQQISDEIRERTSTVSSGANAGNATNLTFYSPTVNMQRDPRWGRNEESYSEDVFLNSEMGTQFVLGMEGKKQDGSMLDPKGYYKLVSTTKHYTANNSERNRLNGGAETDLRALREYYTAPYRNIIQNAGVSSVMTAYSTVNGEPCTISSYLMETLLRQTFGFTGYITSDCDATSSVKRHNYIDPYTGKVLTPVEQYSFAMAHGDDLECDGGYDNNQIGSYKTLAADMVSQAVETDKGVFTENQIDVSLARLMTARIKTGEFDNNLQLTIDANARKAAYGSASGANQTAERLAIANQVAEEGVVMLQNNDNILPLAIPATDPYNVVIVGSWQTNMYLGLYSTGISTNTINIQKGITDAIKAKNANATVTYITSNTLTDANKTAISAANAVIVVVGTSSSYSAEDVDRTTNALPDNQATLISTVGKLNAKTVAVMETCGPMQVSTFQNDVAGILWSSFGGIHKGVGFGKVITGVANPSGKLTATWYQNVSDTGLSDIPSIYNYNLYKTATDSGRTYMYYQGETPVSYPFGFGLSYSTFEYSNLTLDASAYTADDTITATFNVKNSGSVAGKEIAELYVAQPGADPSLNRPIRRLKGFEKIELAAGETKTLTMKVKIEDLAFFNEAADKYIVDTGAYQILVGGSSATSALTQTADLTVSGTLTEVPSVLSAKPNQTGDSAKGIEERVIFDKGVTVNPQLTVAMNNESLYGYIIKQQSSPVKKETSRDFPAGTTVTYASNRPEVVKVDGDDITTVAPGVATITATLTYNGESATTKFVVYVESTPYLENITVGGTPISGFQSKTFNYSVTLASAAAVPEIETVSSNAALIIDITKPASIPGTAVIKTTNGDNGEKATYYVGLGTAPVTTDFKTGSAEVLAKGWHVLNENATNAAWDETKGLTITSAQGTFGSSTTPENVYLQSAFGDWVAQTEVKFSETPSASNQQAGLIVYNDNLNYLRFVYERPTSGTSNVVRAYKCANGTETQVASVTAAALTELRMQIVKQGSGYTFKYSTDGTNWTALSSTASVVYNCPQIGVLADNGSAAGAAAISATFEQLLMIPVQDLYPRLTGIKLDGENLNGFSADKLTYNIEVAKDAVVVPVITATAAAGYTVEVKQLTGVTGSATVTVSSQAANTTYNLYFDFGPNSDYFADGSYKSSAWTILNPDATAYSVEKGKGIVLPTQRYDIYSTGGAWKNCFVTPAMGDAWEAVAKIVYPQLPNANYQQAMFLVWQDQDNYLRLNCQQSSLRIEPGVEKAGSFGGSGLSNGTAVKSSDNTVTLYLKFKKNGTSYDFAWSQDGKSYASLGTATDINFSNPKLALFASMNNSGTPINADFEYMTVTSRNGVEQVSYQQMLEDATQNVLDYVKADIGTSVAETAKRLTIAPVPHGYTLGIVSSDKNVISDDGQITHDENDAKSATLTLTVTDTASNIVKTEDVTITVPAYKIVKNVISDLEAKTYTDTQTVTLSTATTGATIYYTTDGSTPTTASTLYVNPITVDDSMVLKAIAVKDGYVSSDVASFDYKIYVSKLEKPTTSPNAGIITEAKMVTLSTATAGATIYYTTDGSAPTKLSTKYTVPFKVDKTTIVKAIAVMSRYEPSDVATFNYFMSTSTGADDAGEGGGGRTDLSLAKEYEDYFRMGTFGAFNAGDWSYQGNVSSPANAIKLEGQIGNSNTNSKSRQAYTAAIAAIDADATITDKEAAKKIANENVVLDSSSQASGISMLNEIRTWNAANPDNQKKVRAHCLAWHGGQQPNYFFCDGFVYDSSKTLAEQAAPEDVMLARLDNYIRQMMQVYSEYKDIIIAWDVVNEALDDYSGQIRNSEDYQVGQWGTVFRHEELNGDERLKAESAWVRQAFASARKWSTENGCSWKLYYNDFQDSNKPYEPKMSQTIKMLSYIPDDDIDGYGLQGRLSFAYPSIDQIKAQIDKAFLETGCEEISFTESDIRSDFITNPDYDETQPSTRVVASDPQWPTNGSGSSSNISAANGNTFDVTNSPVKRDPDWGTGSNNTLATSVAKMTAQADYAAALMDLLIGYAKDGKVAVYQWDGTNDSGTFNSTTGCTMWDSSSNPKYSFYAVAGAPSRAKLNDLLKGAPSDSKESKYSSDSWQAYQAAKAIAEPLATQSIYNQQGVDNVKTATQVLKQAIDNLTEVIPGSVSFLTKGNAGNFQILNQASSKIVPGKGLLMTNTAARS